MEIWIQRHHATLGRDRVWLAGLGAWLALGGAFVMTAAAAEKIERGFLEREVTLDHRYLNVPVKADGVRQMRTFPCELQLVTTEAGPRLRRHPIREIEKIQGAKILEHDLRLRAGEPLRTWAAGAQFRLKVRLELKKSSEVTVSVRGVPLTINADAKQLLVRGYVVPLALKDGALDLDLLVDRSSLGIFAGGGNVYLPLSMTFPVTEHAVTAAAHGSDVVATSFELIALNSI